MRNGIKGYSSFMIRKKNSWMKKYKAFWSSSYFVESIGNISESTVRKYIRNQRINVKSTYKYKSIVKNHFNRFAFKMSHFKGEKG